MNSLRVVPTAAFLFWSSLLLPISGEARQIDDKTARVVRKLRAVRATGPIRVDGSLDEPDWNRAPVADGFIQNDPQEGEPASEDTEVRVLYDTDNLYVGVVAYDRDPMEILTSELAKDFDRLSGDDFEVVLDTFHDERNGYMFATNARGAKWDAQMINEGREINENWDALWDVKARITETGWYAEIAIPFRTLRFSSADAQTWGINFQRRIRRRNEDSFWAPLPRIYDLQRVSLAGTLEGLQGVRPGNDLRIKPYVLGSSGKSNLVKIGTDFNGGLDVKYGVTSSLTWDSTIKTDFSQVEADEQQVNLTRFNLFFPEKRDFFLENSGIFQFGLNTRGSGGAPAGGGSLGGRQNNTQDAILFFSRRIGLSDANEAIPILGGTRLTGRVGDYSLGAFSIQQQSTKSSAATNFAALRLRRNVLSNSDVGMVVLNKDVDGPRYNRLIGADANFRFFENLNVFAFTAKTFSPAAVRPGSGGDVMGRAGFTYRDLAWDFGLSYLQIGERFNDEMGFVPRTGVSKVHGVIGPYFRPKLTSKWLRETHPHFEIQNVTRIGGALDSRFFDYHWPLLFQNGGFVEVGLNPSAENLAVPFVINRRRGVAIPAGRYDYNEWFALWRTNPSAPFSFNGRWSVGSFYDGYKHTYQLGGTTRLRGQFNASLNWSRNQIDLRAGRYTTDLITARIEYGFSTKAVANALVQYNTDAREWSSNVRFNIIHHPLSDFFLVFNERRDSDSGGLLDRALVAKMTYLMGF